VRDAIGARVEIVAAQPEQEEIRRVVGGRTAALRAEVTL
jgi:hypothetical protein